jgi:hypothetical protein
MISIYLSTYLPTYLPIYLSISIDLSVKYMNSRCPWWRGHCENDQSIIAFHRFDGLKSIEWEQSSKLVIRIYAGGDSLRNQKATATTADLLSFEQEEHFLA